MYDPKNEEDDMREMEEERLRMREHVMKNVRRGPAAGGGRREGGLACHLRLPGSPGGHQPGPPCDPGGVPRVHPEEGVRGHRGGLGGEVVGALRVLNLSLPQT